DGVRVEGGEQFKRMISETPAGRNVKLLISRDGAPQTVSLKLEERSASMHRNNEDWVMPMPATPMPPMPPSTPRTPRAVIPNWPNFNGETFSVFGNTPRLGIEGEEIGSQLGEFFGVPDKGGVLVREVTSGSAA